MTAVIKSTESRSTSAEQFFLLDTGDRKNLILQSWDKGYGFAAITALASLVIPFGLYLIYDVCKTAHQNRQQRFSTLLDHYANAQIALSAGVPIKTRANLKEYQLEAMQAMMRDAVEKARTTLLGRVVDLTNQANSEEGRAHLQAAKKLIDERFQAKHIGEGVRHKAGNAFSYHVREVAVDRLISGLNLAENLLNTTLDKQAEEMVARGYFVSKEEAVNSIHTAHTYAILQTYLQ